MTDPQPKPQNFNFNIDPQIALGRFADTINITGDANEICMTFAVKEPFSIKPGQQEDIVCNVVTRIYMSWELAKIIQQSLAKLTVQKTVMSSENLSTYKAEA